MVFKDIKLDDDGDLLIVNGDFVIDFSDQQNVEDIIDAFVGSYKEFPALGVGIKAYQGSSGQEQKLEQAIKLQLQADGFNVSGLRCKQNSNSEFEINAQNITR